MTAREAAARSLLRIEKEGRYSNLETDLTLRKEGLEDAEARLYTRLVYGTVERKLTLDYLTAPLVSCDYEKLDPEVRVILRMSAYQIFFSDRIPSSAAVNEGVNLCKKFKRSAAPMVNAVLRRLCRERANMAFPSKEERPVEYLSVFYSVSPEICELIYRQMGFEESCRMFEKMNETPPLTLRVNTLKTSREDFCRRFEEKGVSCVRTVFSESGVNIRQAASEVEELKRGLCFVQDEASQLCVEALDARPGMTVIDCCACPGGKSFGAAINMKNIGSVLSFDIHENKLSLVEKGAETLGISILHTQKADGRAFRSDLEGLADRVLCDLPCSGLGVIAKKPDLRYKKEEEMAKLPEIQWAILDNVCRYVKKGGKLVFSTCTVLKRENEALFERFLAGHPEFCAEALALPQNLSGGRPYLTMYPHIHGTDGFFISSFVRKA